MEIQFARRRRIVVYSSIGRHEYRKSKGAATSAPAESDFPAKFAFSRWPQLSARPIDGGAAVGRL